MIRHRGSVEGVNPSELARLVLATARVLADSERTDEIHVAEELTGRARFAELRRTLFGDAEARALLAERPGCLVLDAQVRDFDSPDHLAIFACICARHPVLLLVDRGDVPIAVRAIKDGAADVFEKPCRDERLLESIKRATAAAEDAETDR